MKPTFALIGHPAYVKHLQRYLEWLKPGHKAVNPRLLTRVFQWAPAYVVRPLDTVVSRTGERRDGIFITATIMPEMVDLNPQQAFGKIVEACQVADREGARITTLGGLTSAAGAMAPDALVASVGNNITTGNSFTVAMVIRQLEQIAQQAGVALEQLDLAVLGGTGDIGSTCAELLAARFGGVTLTSRKRSRLGWLAERIKQRYGVEITLSEDNVQAVKEADVVIAATSASTPILDGSAFKPGAIVCDVGYPKNIRRLINKREDILVFLGGVCRQERPIEFGFDIDLPRQDMLYGCFAEALLLDFESNYCNYSMGRGNITPEAVEEMAALGDKHGYTPAPPCQTSEFLTGQEICDIVANNPKLR